MVKGQIVLIRMPKAFKDIVVKKVKKEGITLSEAVRKSLSKKYGIKNKVKDKAVRPYKIKA